MIAMSFAFATAARARPAKARALPFESGVSLGPPKQQRFTVSFYLTAMLFILFDIEIVFLYPLAVILDKLAWFGFFEFLFFLVDPRRRLRLHLAEGGARVAVDAEEAARRLRAPLRARALAGQGPGQVRAGAVGDELEERLGLTTLAKAVAWSQTKSMWPDHVRARLLRDRDDVDRLVALRHRALRDGGVPLVAAPGRPADRLGPRRRTRWRRRCARSTTRCSSRSG